jgi:hypothetical protein
LRFAVLVVLLAACGSADVAGEAPPTAETPTGETTLPIDRDGDGFAAIESGGDDCDDGDDAIFPGAHDNWYDGVDADCAGNCDWDADADGAADADRPAGDPACDALPVAADCDDGDPAATWLLLATDPPDAALVPVDTAFRATFGGGPSAAMLTLIDGAGNPVLGTASLDGDTAVFTPDAPLLGGSSYTLGISSPCGDEVRHVTTLVDGAGLVGQVWELDWASGEWTVPGSPVELMFRVVIGSEALQVEILAADQARLGSEVIKAPPWPQDLCAPTADLPLDLSVNPAFSIAPLALQAGGVPVPLEAGAITGHIAQGGGSLTEVTLTGAFDIAALDPVVDGGSACDTFASFGLTCGLCPVSGATTCIAAQIDQVPATRIAASPLVVRSEADVLGDPTCTP